MSVGRFASYNLVASLLIQMIALVTVPLYISLIGLERFGVLSLAWVLLGSFGLFDLGLGRATAFRIAAQKVAEPAERAITFWSALAVNGAMGFVGALALWLAGRWFFQHKFDVDEALRPEIIEALPLLAAALPIAIVAGVLTGSLQGREKFLSINKVSVTSTTLFQLLPLSIAWLYSSKIIYLLAGALIARLIALIVLSNECRKEVFGGHPVRVKREAMRDLLGFGGWVSLNALIGSFLSIFDRFAIGAILGAKAVGYYAVPMQLAKKLTIVPTSLGSAMFPRMAASDADQSDRIAHKAMLTLNAALLPITAGAVVLLEPFMTLWVGRDIAVAAATTGRVLFIGYWLSALTIVPFTRLQSSGRPRIVTIILLLQLPFYMAALWYGMKNFGLLGCALAMAFRFLMDFLMQCWAANRGVPSFGTISVSAFILGACLIVASLVPVYTPLWWLLSVLLAILSCGYAYKTCPPDLSKTAIGWFRKRVGRA